MREVNMEKSTVRPCCVPECDRFTSPKTARGMCNLHYNRWQRSGSTDLPLKMKDKPCVVDGCDRPARRFDRCDGHSQYFRKYGLDKIELQKRAAERFCVVCGAEDWPPNGKRVCCSARCFYYKQKYGGPPPALRCVLCDCEIDMTKPTKRGRRKQSTTKFCARCKQARMLKHKTSVAVLAERDGTDCGICGDPVDMSLKRPELLSPSVDHIIPRGRGGSNEPDNVQLAHLYCNFVKNDRIGFTM